MNKKGFFLRGSTAVLILGFSASCTTTYDSYGRSRQTVDPGLAVAGVAAAGLIGYALGRDDDHHYRSGHRVTYHETHVSAYPRYGCYVPTPCYYGY